MGRCKLLLAMLSIYFFQGTHLALSQTTSQSASTGEGQKHVCREDIKKFCPDVKKGKGRIIDCLGSHSAELNTECKSRIDEIIKGRDACKSDAEKLCKDKKAGEGLGVCMKQNANNLSAECKAFTEKAMAHRQKKKERRANKKAKQSEGADNTSDELADDLENN